MNEVKIVLGDTGIDEERTAYAHMYVHCSVREALRNIVFVVP